MQHIQGQSRSCHRREGLRQGMAPRRDREKPGRCHFKSYGRNSLSWSLIRSKK